jgi:rhodanese-related sulfurtransferase
VTDAPPVPAGRRVGIDELLERVRADLDRVQARAAHDAARAGDALLVDIRYAALRERDGLIPGALVVERNELEWRLDPQGSHRAPEATGHDLRVVVVCDEGYASSLAAVSLRQLGLHRATDLVGGFQAWRSAGLPVDVETAVVPAAPPGAASSGTRGPQKSSSPRDSVSSPSSSSA